MSTGSSPNVLALPLALIRMFVCTAGLASLFLATNCTWKLPTLVPTFQENVPPVFVAFGTNVAPLLAGIFTGDMVSDVMASPSESIAVIVNVTVAPALAFTMLGANTTGARSVPGCGGGGNAGGANSNAPRSP